MPLTSAQHFSRRNALSILGAAIALLAMAGATNLGATTRPARLVLRSAAVLIQDQASGERLYQKHTDEALPIASITKLMTAMVVLDARTDLKQTLTILEEDKDVLRHSRSRLPVGTRMTVEEALRVALMASENRAAHALGRTYPGGLAACVAAMNAKAHTLGLQETRFEDPAGLSGGNLSSARDLVKVVDQAHHYPVIRSDSTTASTLIQSGRRTLEFHNTNHLIQSSAWQIGLSKTGYIEESGQCLVMQAQLARRSLLIVLLDANGRESRFNDANRIRQWLEGAPPKLAAHHPSHPHHRHRA